MAGRYVRPSYQYFDNSGRVLDSGQLFFYDSGTTTLKNVYSDPDGLIPIDNPVVLDGAGRTPNVYLEGSYKLIIKDKNDVQIEERDPVLAADDTTKGFADWNAVTTYSELDIVRASNNLLYISITNSNQNNEPSASATNWTQVQLLSSYNANETYSIGDVVIDSIGDIYRSLTNSNVGNTPASSPTDWSNTVSGAFGSENILTTGTLGAGATTLSTLAVTGNVDFGTTGVITSGEKLSVADYTGIETSSSTYATLSLKNSGTYASGARHLNLFDSSGTKRTGFGLTSGVVTTFDVALSMEIAETGGSTGDILKLTKGGYSATLSHDNSYSTWNLNTAARGYQWSINGTPAFTIATSGAATFAGNINTGTFASNGATAGTLIEASGFLASSSTGTSSFTSRGFYNANGLVGSITTNGSATAYNTSSDPRLKSEFVAMDDAWAAQAVIDSIENKWAGVFYFEADPDTPVAGYNSHALIDNQLGYGGTEGEGPRDAEIGSVYEAAVYEQATDEDGTLLFDDVTEKARRPRTWQKPVLETFDEVVPAVTEQKAVINEETGEPEIITVVVEEETTRKAERQKTESVTETVTVAEAVVGGVLIPEHEETKTTEKPVFTTENVLDQHGSIVYEEYDKVIGTKPRMVEVSPEKRVSPAGVDQSKRVPLLEAALYNALKRIEALEG
jgi:hypothetical protein